MSQPKEILVATDFSPVGNPAVNYAIDLAKALNANLHILHVCEPVVDMGSMSVELNTIDQVERDAHTRLAQLRKSMSANGVAISCIVEVGAPASEIIDSATRLHVDLVVMGTHGRRGLRRALLGSVAESVLRGAPCPVLVVRPPEHQPR